MLARVAKLRNRRSRVLDAFIDGDIDRAEKDRGLALIQGELTAAEEELARGAPATAVSVSEVDVVALAPVLAGCRYLSRLDRRGVSAALAPSFSVRRLPFVVNFLDSRGQPCALKNVLGRDARVCTSGCRERLA